MCLSAKSSRYQNFLYVDDIPTLAESCDEFECNMMSDDELDELHQKYSMFYQSTNSPTGEIREMCRLPFFARILYEAYSSSTIPLRIPHQELIAKFLSSKLKKILTEHRNTAEILLEKIAKIMLDRGSIYVSLAEVYDAFTQPLETGLNLLIEHYFLTKEGNNIAFYFDRVRDHFIVFRVRKWDKLTCNEFRIELNSSMQNLVAQSAISWYLEIGSERHQESMDDFVESRFIKYVTILDSYLNENFRDIKHLFVPGAKERIGITLFKSVNGSFMGFTYRAAADDEELIKWEVFSHPREPLQKYKTVWHIGGHFGGQDVENLVVNHISTQLKRILDQKLLYEGAFELTERLIYIILEYKTELGLIPILDRFKRLKMSFWKKIFPLSVAEFKSYNLKHMKLWLKHQLELFDTNADTISNGRFEYRTMTFGYEEDKRIDDLVKRELSTSSDSLGDEKQDDQVIGIIKIVRDLAKQTATIEKPPLLFNYKKKESELLGALLLEEYSANGFKRYLEEFFRLFITEYRVLVENNFSQVKKYMPLYSSWPYYVIAEFNIKKDPKEVTYAILKNKFSNRNEIEIKSKGRKSIFNIKDTRIETKLGDLDLQTYTSRHISGFLGKFIIMNWCYESIKKDLIEALRQKGLTFGYL